MNTTSRRISQTLWTKIIALMLKYLKDNDPPVESKLYLHGNLVVIPGELLMLSIRIPNSGGVICFYQMFWITQNQRIVFTLVIYLKESVSPPAALMEGRPCVCVMFSNVSPMCKSVETQ